MKTGYTKEAGYCLTATAKKDGMRLIAVAMGEPDSATRNSEITSLLDYSFAQYEVTDLLKNNTLGKYKVDKAKSETVKIIPKEQATILNKKNDQKKTYSYDVDIDSIEAPVKKGDVVGKLTIKQDNKKIRTINLTVDKDIKKANLLELYLRHLKEIVTGDISFK